MDTQKTLTARFKKLAIASQFTMHDGSGNVLYYAKQKLFKLKEQIMVYGDESQTSLRFTVNADRVIDFSPTFTIADPTGKELLQVKRQGGASLWRAQYAVMKNGVVVASFKEGSGFVKVVDALFSEIPLVGLFAGYILNPKYYMMQGESVAIEKHAVEIVKKPAFLESSFEIHKKADIAGLTDEELNVSLCVLLLFERMRG